MLAFYFIFVMYTCVSVWKCCAHVLRAHRSRKRGLVSLELQVFVCHRCWELNPDPMQKQYAPLTHDLHVRPSHPFGLLNNPLEEFITHIFTHSAKCWLDIILNLLKKASSLSCLIQISWQIYITIFSGLKKTLLIIKNKLVWVLFTKLWDYKS